MGTDDAMYDFERYDSKTSVRRLTFENAVESCASPIEDVLLYTLGACSSLFMIIAARNLADIVDGARDAPAGMAVIAAQVPVGRYRCDFVVGRWFDAHVEMIAIECDGHAWHNAHEWQRERDRKRDLFLRRSGLSVIRVPGHLLMSDPQACAAVVLRELGMSRSGR